MNANLSLSKKKCVLFGSGWRTSLALAKSWKDDCNAGEDEDEDQNDDKDDGDDDDVDDGDDGDDVDDYDDGDDDDGGDDDDDRDIDLRRQ